MKKILKLVTLGFAFVLILAGCGDKLGSMKDSYNDFKKNIDGKGNGYTLTVKTPEGTNYFLDYTSDEEYSIILNNGSDEYEYICSGEESIYKLNGKETDDGGFSICQEEFQINEVGYMLEDVDTLELFSKDTKVSVEDDFYVAIKEDREIKIHKNGKKIIVIDEIAEVTIELK